ncbi:MAG: hypothetical protein E7323_02780 [Clostridiales bacterium]|nr:hypothetical protein [Clostridiales bacterium]
MAKNVSPFAALTSEEKQIKWMEYQTIRLPYTDVSNTNWNEAQKKEQPEQSLQPNAIVKRESVYIAAEDRYSDSESLQSNDLKQQRMPSGKTQASRPAGRPLPPPEVYVRSHSKQHDRMGTDPQTMPTTAYQQLNQKTRHRQYDAVIERMKQAERKTGNYHSWSK